MERCGLSDLREDGAMHGPHESVEHFLERTKEQRTRPTWADLRKRNDHADKAYEFLSSAPFHGDADMARVMVDAATVHATLALHDKVDELCQALKHVGAQAIETNAELSATVKKATNSVVTELRKATVREAA
jgi:uncharacterized protein YhaN